MPLLGQRPAVIGGIGVYDGTPAFKRKKVLEDIAIWQLALVFITAAIGLSLSGVAGFGGGVLVLPVLVWVYSPEIAVPVVAVFQLFGTISRVWINREFLRDAFDSSIEITCLLL